MKKTVFNWIWVFLFCFSAYLFVGCVSYLSPSFHIYEGEKKSPYELAVVRLDLSSGTLESVDGMEVYLSKMVPAFFYLLPGERKVVVSCYSYIGESKSEMKKIEGIERYSIELKADWLYRLEIQGYDPENEKCIYTYKFKPYGTGMQEGLKPKFK